MAGLAAEERVVVFFLADGGEGAVSRANNRLIRQGHQTGAAGFQSFRIADHAPAHGTGEKSVADNGQRLGKTGDDIRDAAPGVAAGAAC
ncbi:MAG: hypothetical protein EB036_14670, partial [Betaproteobacteria bacterium]|nr:hypothetical protein [Betaproteobacteria bacterium]